ncbi:MAG: peptidoglycan bridge formation glycyltransferase FemA/FemB family protein [Chloroflexi bacterium]|nr:peptidoglycan bridge formation glycyltransferase FemA/FemB family protein [Chloroflexota bacterium]MBU1749870.1 peptidoglycan bridge formation glycyltransferase FemA/FemB family protein [Chloroflexota bacterium]MBU1877602.1 peptidoglycan bridge formation glycyltransferase FemA/FemB family protein [Chloroflexota bacterium]
MNQAKIITQRETWNQALLTIPHAHVLQSYEWGEFKARYGWRPTRLLFEEDDQPVAAASLLSRRLPWRTHTIAYVPKGPVLDYTQCPVDAQSDASRWDRVLAGIIEQARRQRAVFVKIDPDVSVSDAGALDALRRAGFSPSTEQIQFKNTMLLDLRQSDDELLAAMKPKTRYNVRLAARRGVVVTPGGEPDLLLFYQMYAETATRDAFIIRPYAYYLDAWGLFLQRGLAHLLIARYEDEPVAAVLLFRYGRRAWYMYGASTGRHRRHMPNYLLQWAAMRHLRDLGCDTYDLWGLPDDLNEPANEDEREDMWGVYRFKLGLGGQVVRHIGAYDRPLNRPLYWLWTRALPRYLALLRRGYTPA